jgi:ATP/maltotriose-dependent transcriptional regulator MalT/DNA-binding SARP family transcriptional activator
LRRVRLIDTLHQHLHRKLTFVSAPAGYGKTTLLVDFAADVDALVCWYRIGPEDGDLVQFVSHLVAAFQQQVPKFGEAIQDNLNTPGATADAASLAAELINEVEEKVEDFTLLILDDYHLAGENQQIVDFIEHLIEHLPDHLRILIGSRSVYGIPTASLYIREELITISADELRFRPDELQKLVLQNYRLRLSSEQAEEFAKRADGWIIAILLAVRTMDEGGLPKFTGAIEQVYSYLAEEVVSRQSTDLRDFMFATSILGDFNEALCNYLLQRKDSTLFLRSLEERNLFVSRTETREGNSYRYHQLFSEFLQDYFQRSQPARKKDLHSRAAGWHKDREEWEDAIGHKLSAGDKSEAAKWMDSVAGEYYTSGRQVLLGRWVEKLRAEPDIRQQAPRLLLYQAKTLGNQSQFEPSLQLLDIAEPILQTENDKESLANATITRGMIYRFVGRHQEAIALAEQAQQVLDSKGGGRRDSRQWFQAERLKAVPAFYLGETRRAITFLNSAVSGLRELVSSSDDRLRSVYLYDLAECLNDLGFIYTTSSQMLNAQKAFQEVLDIHLRIRSNLGALASARNNIAYLHHQIGHYADAWRQYTLALENAESANRVLVQIGILNGRGELLLELEEVDEAQENFEKALALSKKSGQTQELAVTYVGLAQADRQRDNYNEAMNWLRQAASSVGGSLDKSEYALHLGTIYSDMGQRELALKQFLTAYADWRTGALPRQSHVLAAFLAAEIYYQKGDRAQAQELLELALEGGANLGYDQFLVIAARQATQFLSYVAETSPTVQVKSLLERVESFTPGKGVVEGAAPVEDVPSINLQVQAFGLGEIRKDGELLPSTVWRSSRARALFFYILDRQKVRKETIGLEFWPDFSPGKISSNFHATLWRVRRALGFKDAIVFEDDVYSLHPALKIWYDVAEFQSYTRQASNEDLSAGEQAELLRQAARLYQGAYLQDVYMDWADKRRDELRNQYLNTLVRLAAMENRSKRYHEARTLYEKIIAVDPYRDEIHLELMKVLALSGSPSSAMAHFKRYKAMLHKELNAEPLADLQRYYEKLAVKA